MAVASTLRLPTFALGATAGQANWFEWSGLPTDGFHRTTVDAWL
jgi:hypothetical protein